MLDGPCQVPSHSEGVVNDQRNAMIVCNLQDVTHQKWSDEIVLKRALAKAGMSLTLYLGLAMLST